MGEQSESRITIIPLFTEYGMTGKILSKVTVVAAALSYRAVAAASCSAVALTTAPKPVRKIHRRACVHACTFLCSSASVLLLIATEKLSN